MGGIIKFLGIDVGTSGTRALIIDEHGRVVASGTAGHESFASPQLGGRNSLRRIGGELAKWRFDSLSKLREPAEMKSPA